MWPSLFAQFSGIRSLLLPALLDAACKGIAIMSLTALTALAMRRTSAASRHLVWFLGSLCLLFLPILSAALPGWNILPPWAGSVAAPPQATLAPLAAPVEIAPVFPPSAPAQSDRPQLHSEQQFPASASADSPASALRPPTVSTPSSHQVAWQAWTMLAWLVGCACYLGYVALGFVSLAWLQRRSSRIVTGSWPILLQELSAELRFRRPVELLSSLRRTMPMTWGLWRTRLLLPEDAADWTVEQRRAVLLHELAHAKRLDCLTQFVAQIVCALHWFNPLAWLASRRMQAERELACDDMVLNCGTKASAYAEQLLRIASEMPAVRFSTAAIAMARPSKLEGRLLAILDTSRRRRLAVRTIILASLAIGISALLLAIIHAEEAPQGRALQAVSRWAADHGYKAQWVTETTLESKWGGAWRNLSFSLSADEEADARACIKLAEQSHFWVNGKTEFSSPATRAALEDILKKRPGYFYAEFLLAQWRRDRGDTQAAAALLESAYQHAPIIIVERYEFADGSPLADAPISQFALECNRVTHHSLDPSLQLLYPYLRTDADGCIYLPVYNTVCRTNDMAWPDGYTVTFPTLGWFETSRKVGLLPAATVAPKPGDFAPAASASQGPTAVATLSGDNRVELLAISPYPDPQNIWWRPDGSPSTHQYQTGEPGLSPWPAENGRRFVFRFAKALDPDAHVQFRFSALSQSQSHYTTVRAQDIDKPYVLFTVFPTHPGSVTIRLGEASGPWKPVAQYDPRTKSTTGDLSASFGFQDLTAINENQSELCVAHPQTDLEIRLIAIESDGKEHAAAMTYFSRDQIITDHFRFEHLPLIKISSFRLETRKYQWAEFGNIALKAVDAAGLGREVPTDRDEPAKSTVAKLAAAPSTTTAPNSGEATWPPTPQLVGEWSGAARIVVNWTQQRRLPVSVVIAADGTVTGSVGDAKLMGGRVRPNRGSLFRALNWATDFIISGKLQGPIIASEGITRDGVLIPFNLVKGQLVGGVNSSGSKFGGRESMVLAAGNMVLRPTVLPAASQPATAPAATTRP